MKKNKEKKKNRELLFSVTKQDCNWSYTRGTGSGGQKKNKTSSAVHCSHPPSGAEGYSEDTRSQHQNKKIAFERMANTQEFKKWHKLEVARRTGVLDQIDREVEQQMKNVKVEYKQDGVWVESDKILSNNENAENEN